MATSSRAMTLQGRAEPLVSQEFDGPAAEPEVATTQQPRSTLFRHLAGAAAVLVAFCLAGVCLLPLSGISLLSPMKQQGGLKPFTHKPFKAKSKQVIEMEEYIPAVDDIVCDKFPYYEIQEVLHTNLGGKGPDSGDEGIVYKLKHANEETYMLMHLNAQGDYSPSIPKYNGCAGLQVLTGKQCKGRFGAINLKAGTEAEFDISFYDVETKEPIEVQNAAITWFDIDENKGHTNTEQVGMKGFKEYRLHNPSNVTKEEREDGMTLWKSSSYGDGRNNPIGPEGLTTGQKSLAVTVFYHKSKTMHAHLGAGGGGVDQATGEEVKAMPRFFTFILMPSIPCARTLLPALTWKGPNESPVEGTGEFYKWKKEVGDPVKKGDVIALVKNKDGSIKEILATKDGYVTQRQPFKMGDVMEQRMEAQPIAVISSEDTAGKGLGGSGAQLPPLSVGDGQVGVEEEGIFVEWVANVGDKVKEGDVLARVNVTEHGPTVDVLAPYQGTVTDRQPFKPGDVMEDRMVKQPIAVITSLGTLPMSGDDTAVEVPNHPDSGKEFVEYKVEVGDPVKEGDVIAIVKDKETGELTELKAEKDGFVKSLQLLTPGAPIDDVTEDGRLAVIASEKPKLVPLNQNHPFDPIEPSTKDGVKFKKFLVEPGEEVNVGDPIAVVTHPDGTDEVLFAPEAGTVKSLQNLKEGDPLDEVLETDDYALATVVPHHDDIGDLPVYTTLPPNNFPEGTKFGKWLVNEGDDVNQGDKVAEVTLPDGSKQYLLAPATGTVVSLNTDLDNGAELKGNGDDLTIMTPSDKAIETCVDAPDLPGETILVAWHVAVGDVIKAGDKIATIKKPDGSTEIITNSKSGTVAEMGSLKPNDKFANAKDECLVKIVSSPGEPGATYYPVDTSTLPGDTILKEFMVEEGDKVKEGDPIAKVQLPNGDIVTLTAGHDGWVDELIGNPGDKLDDLPDNVNSVASIVDRPVPEGVLMDGGGEQVPQGTTTVSAVPGDVLVEWRKRVGDPVKEGDVIAIIQQNGERVEVKSPRDGIVQARAPIDDGDPITRHTSSPLAIIEDPTLSDTTKVQGATVEPGDILVSWHAAPGDFVKAGEVIAVVRRDGKETPVKAGTTGKLIFEQPLGPGDTITKGKHDPLFQIDPFTPPFEETGASTQDGNKLVKWNFEVGDEVTKGDVVAVVEQDGEQIPVHAPQNGTLSFRQDVDEGEEIPSEKASPLFLVKNPNPLPDKVRGVSAMPDDKLVSWKKNPDDPVKKGDVIAVVERNGQQVELKAPHDGKVTFEQDINPGDTITEPNHSPMFLVEAPQPLGGSGEGQNVEPGDKLVEWKHKMEDPVKKGDVIAVIERDGKQIPVQATKDGFVSYTAPVNPGEEVTPENSEPLFSIDDGPYRALPHGTGQSADPGDKLLRWHKNEGAVVRQGDLVATLDRDGVEVPVYAPRDGVITFQEDLDAGDEITDATSNPIFVVTPPETEVPVGVAVNAKPGDIFVEWKKNVPDEVPKGETIAVIERDGELLELKAPTSGHVSYQNDLKPGDKIDSSNDAPVFLIDDRKYGPTDGTPVLGPDAEALGYQFIRFKDWAVAPGDRVETGDAIATVELVPYGMARRLAELSSDAGRRRLEAMSPKERRLTLLSLLPKEMQVLSPADGCVTDTMDLKKDDRLEDNYASRNFATIKRCPFHWSLWILLLLFVLLCCLCCCIFVCLKKRREDEYNKMKKVGDTGAAGPGMVPTFDKPEEPITFDFRDHEGKIHSFKFTHRPLGIVYEKHSSPVRVQRLKYNSYAKWMGVREGWVIDKVLRTDVSGKTVEEVEQVTHDYLRDKPIWPLRLDFRKPLAAGKKVPKDGDTFEKRPISFFCTTQPIGLEFAHNKIPIIVSRVFPDTYAKDQGIEEHWKLTGIGHNSDKDEPLLSLEQDPEDLDYRDIMKKFRDAVSLLDLREDNPEILTNAQKEKWEDNLGDELTGHSKTKTNQNS